MNEIEKHVTSLELSRRLKGLGCPQKSLFWWVQDGDLVTPVHNEEYIGLNPAMWTATDQPCPFGDDIKFIASAYLTSELGEWLHSIKIDLWQYHNDGKFLLKTMTHDAPDMNEATECDCRAKMLIWLIENGIVKFGEPLTHKTLEIEENGKKYRYDRGGFEPVN